MKTIDINTSLIDGYLHMLENLSTGNKLDLISKLTQSVKTDITKSKKLFYKSYGAWEPGKSAEEMIKEIRESRKFSRQIEGF